MLHLVTPSATLSQQAVQKITDFFQSKVNSIKQQTNALAAQLSTAETLSRQEPKERLSVLQPVSVDEVERLLARMVNKSCHLDIIPIHLRKQLLSIVSPLIVTLAKVSFQSGTFPSALKFAHVTLILKK